MSTPVERIQADVKAAMKAREAERLATLRMLLTAIKNEQIARGAELDEESFLAVVKRSIKQRRDAADQYRKGGREELAAKEEREAEILEAYLPAQAGEDEIRRAVEDFVAAEGLSGPKAMGPVMKAMMARFGASADGAVISRIARQVLNP
ncbi:MAG: GatB/YqeY domain-containing protein [Acidobacteria bacterium]|nr:MAG: GatB/YqeY domain-containing protein [Acidobacteriota bacterium]